LRKKSKRARFSSLEAETMRTPISFFRENAARPAKACVVAVTAMLAWHTCDVGRAADITSTWDDSDGNWSDPARWDSANFPNNGNDGLTYDAVLFSGTATLDVDIALQGLQLLFGVNLVGPGNLTVEESFLWDRGNLSGTGAVVLNGDSTIRRGASVLDQVIDNHGAAVFDGAISNSGRNGTSQAVWNNHAGASVELNGFDLNNESGGIGTFHNHAGGTFLALGESFVHWQFQNDGQFDVDSGQLWLRGGANSGAMNVEAGATLAIHSYDSSFTHTGTVVAAGTFEVDTIFGHEVVFEAGSSYMPTGLTRVYGDLVFDTAAALADLALSGSIGGSGEVTVNGLFNWSGGALKGTGAFALHDESTITNGGTLDRVVDNYGSAVFEEGPSTVNFRTGTAQAVWNNRAGASAELENFDLDGNGTFHNHAGAALTASGVDSQSFIYWQFPNDGLVDVDSGQLHFRGSTANSGTIQVQAGAALWFDSHFTNSPSGLVKIEGDSGDFLDTNFMNQGRVLVDSGGHFDLNYVNFSNPGTLEVRDATATIWNTSSIQGEAAFPGPPDFIAPLHGGFGALLEGTWIAGPGATIVLDQLLPKSEGQYGAFLRRNDAVVVLDGPGSNISTIDSLWENQGTFEIRGGRDISLNGEPPGLELLAQPFINTGTIRVGAGSTLTFPEQLGLRNAAGSHLEGEGAIVGNVQLAGSTISSGDTLSIDPSGAVEVSTGTSTLAAGTLAVNGPMSIVAGGHLVVAAGATLGGSGTLNLEEGLITVEGTIAKPVRITGAFALSGTLADATLDGATLNAANGAGFGLVNCFGHNEIQAGAINVNGQLLVNDGGTLVLGAGASILTSGSVELFDLSNMVLDGELIATADATISGTLAVNAGATAQADNWSFTGQSLVKVHGKLKSSGSAEVTGTLAVDLAGEIDVPDVSLLGLPNLPASLAGAGKINGNVHAGTLSTVSPGNSPGSLTVGTTTFAGGATLDLEIRDALGISGVDYDLLAVEGDLTNLGTTSDPMLISLSSINELDEPGEAVNFDDTQTYSWTVATATGAISGFSAGTYLLDASEFQNDLGNGAFFLTTGDAGHSLLVHFSPDGAPPTLAGDFNLDGFVDAADYVVWRKGLGGPFIQEDYGTWRAHFGNGAGDGGAANAAENSGSLVPEPSSWLLCAGFLLAVWPNARQTRFRLAGVKPRL
jgi:hypothetical protein